MIKLYSHKRIEGSVTKIFCSQLKNSSHILYTYRVEFSHGPMDEVIRYDFFDQDLEHIDKEKLRNWKLTKMLNSAFKFTIGDEVDIVDNGHSLDTVGKIVDIDLDWNGPIYKVELYKLEGSFYKYKLGCLRFPESSLKHQSPDDERNWKLRQILQ